MHKVLIVFGTRPEAIKMAPVIKKLKESASKFETIICTTDQHQQMLKQVLNIFDISPDYSLGIMKPDQSLFDVIVKGLRKIEIVLKEVVPDLVLVQGDTSTTFLASLAAYYLKLKVGHVEAGLRSSDKFNPFPEEINRKLTDCVSDFFFAPTKGAKDNLMREGYREDKIFITGNTVIDALLMTIEIQRDDKIQERMKSRLKEIHGISLDEFRMILVTGHRRESFGTDFESICLGLKRIAENNQDVQIVFPVHLNPNVKEPARRILGFKQNIHLIDPLDYFTFAWLMSKAYLVLTDSGGIQEEAPALGKPVLVMRKKTERQEGITAGTARLVGVNGNNIFAETMKLLKDKQLYNSMAVATNPYGDGKASERILHILNTHF
jgi:UDP-N-acetylglucosamine 2-epimerase (non-hydrolysing)